MADLRFPSNADNDNKPFILFTTHKALYNNVGTKIDAVKTGNSVALYFPANYNIADSLNYQQEATGLTGAAVEALGSGADITVDDVKNTLTAGLSNKQNSSAVAGVIAGAVGSLLGTGGAVGGGVGAASIVGNIAAEKAKSTQVTINPREFMLFKSPNIRTFSFSFNFIPSDEREVNIVPDIVKFFRKAAYPQLSSADTVYNFPEAFNINIGNSSSVIKIPEVFCTGVNVTYNPNSMSYFELNNMPVEITLGLTFQELQPINKAFVDLGY